MALTEAGLARLAELHARQVAQFEPRGGGVPGELFTPVADAAPVRAAGPQALYVVFSTKDDRLHVLVSGSRSRIALCGLATECANHGDVTELACSVCLTRAAERNG